MKIKFSNILISQIIRNRLHTINLPVFKLPQNPDKKIAASIFVPN